MLRPRPCARFWTLTCNPNISGRKGQLDATTAHAIERLYGIARRAAGLRLIRVAPTAAMHKTHRITASTNREVRDALEAGAFDE